MVDKPGIDNPISDQSTASTSGKSEVLVTRRKSQRRYKQKTSIILKDDNVSDKLDIFITSVSNRKEDYKEFNSRLALLETQVERA